MKTQNKRSKNIFKIGLLTLALIMATPLYADPGLPGDGDPGEEAVPISDYWWVLALIGIYFIYKKYQVLQKQ